MDPIVTGVVRRSSGVIVVIKEINMSPDPGKWITLMNYIRHSAPGAYQLTFPDRKTAERAARNIYTTVERNPTWFEVKIVRTGCDVFVIKKEYLQKAVVKNA
jgi:hypothetical protein